MLVMLALRLVFPKNTWLVLPKVEARFGRLTEEEEELANTTTKFALFGRPEITIAQAAAEGIDFLFAVQVAAFDSAMQNIFY